MPTAAEAKSARASAANPARKNARAASSSPPWVFLQPAFFHEAREPHQMREKLGAQLRQLWARSFKAL
eukprot:7149161-Pyramimonas_sp.AAC.1